MSASRSHSINIVAGGPHPSRLSGCVDGVSGGELRGWIVNLDRPGRMEPITCTGSTGEQETFCPFTFRSDVSQANGASMVCSVFPFRCAC